MKPEVGRHVHYVPLSHERMTGEDEAARWAAIIVHVWSDTCVNLVVFDPNGAVRPHTSVTLAPPEVNPLPGQCEWMPYQKRVGDLTPPEPEVH